MAAINGQVGQFASGKIVQDPNAVTVFEQGFDKVRADETGAAGDQDSLSSHHY
jgi:hypothetical protein